MPLPTCASRPCHILLVSYRLRLLRTSPWTQRWEALHSTREKNLMKKPAPSFGNSLGFSLQKLEHRWDGFPPNLKLIYRAEATHFIYLAQGFQVMELEY